MKKTLLTLVAVTITCATLICSCEKCDWDDGLWAYDMATTDCHTSTDKLAAKDMNTDSVVVDWNQEQRFMTVNHYNMMLDCKGNQNITTTIHRNGDTVWAVEHLGEQGMTDCICLYDNTFTIQHLPQEAFVLVIEIEYSHLGTVMERRKVYEQGYSGLSFWAKKRGC
jgi:hypothetical protein